MHVGRYVADKEEALHKFPCSSSQTRSQCLHISFGSHVFRKSSSELGPWSDMVDMDQHDRRNRKGEDTLFETESTTGHTNVEAGQGEIESLSPSHTNSYTLMEACLVVDCSQDTSTGEQAGVQNHPAAPDPLVW
ncbi:uncharacterized protein GIQ15_00939 [Arthroderma uncinatum]|uniref:uncharacterized protein n=1 Tax=Arthroderma uncinatum TaxID=74035 RepID=UPI00144A5926|nr:uncharacterized protein GIQ15_00939 [Arthroderma uncinatum]KAF3491422.1 hypothetical protein GIQ15_00939 [Arthroderma uncinatum]